MATLETPVTLTITLAELRVLRLGLDQVAVKGPQGAMLVLNLAAKIDQLVAETIAAPEPAAEDIPEG